MEDKNLTKIKYYSAILFLSGLIFICLGLIQLTYSHRSQKPNSCDTIFTNEKIEEAAWGGQKHQLYIRNQYQIKNLQINDCTIKPIKMISINSSSNYLLCDHSNYFLEINTDGLFRENYKTNIREHLKTPTDMRPVYCNQDKILLLSNEEEAGITYHLFNPNSKKLQSLNLSEITLTAIPIKNHEFVLYRDSDNPGIYLNNQLLIKAEGFGYWDFANRQIIYSQSHTGKTEIYTYFIDTKETTLKRVLNFNISNQIKVSSDIKWLAVKDLKDNLIIFSL